MTNETTQTEPKSLTPFLILWVGQAVSLLGSQIVQFALIWWLTQETGSATVLALATLVGMLPTIVLGPFAGVLVDRWSRRWTMFTADLVIMLATVVLAVLFATGSVQIWHVYAILLVRGAGGAFHWPAMQASTTLMVPEAMLTRIQGFNQMLHGGLNIVAAPLGAVLLSVMTMSQILMIDVVTALAAIIPLLFIAVPQPPHKEKEAEGEISAEITATPSFLASFWEDLRSGLRYVRNWRGLTILIGISMGLNLMLAPIASLTPLLVTEHFNGSALDLGLLEAAFGLGVVLGGVLLGVWGGFKRRIYTTMLGLYVIGTTSLVIGLSPSWLFLLAVGMILIFGAAVSMTNGPILAIFQSTVEPDMQGRVFTLLGSLSTLMTPIGLLIAGPIADLTGISTWYVVAGIATLILTVIGTLSPALIHIEDNNASKRGGPKDGEPPMPDQLLV